MLYSILKYGYMSTKQKAIEQSQLNKFLIKQMVYWTKVNRTKSQFNKILLNKSRFTKQTIAQFTILTNTN